MNFKILDIEILNNKNLGFTISGNIDTFMSVANVNPIGLASKAGLKQNDSILLINGKKIKDREDIINCIKESKDKINLRIIRYNKPELKSRSIMSNKYNSLELNRSISSTKNSNFLRRMSTDVQSLHHDLLHNLGAKVDMEISRSPAPVKKVPDIHRKSELLRRNSADSKYSLIDSMYAHRPGISVERPNSPKQMKNLLELNNQCNAMEFKSRRFSQNSARTLPTSPSSPDIVVVKHVPLRRNMVDFMEKVDKHELSRNLSLRKKITKDHRLSQHQLLSNFNGLDSPISSVSLTKDMTYPKKFSTTNTGSMISLFEEDCPNSVIEDYVIEWRAIFGKISQKTNNEIENEVLNYFHNANIDLKVFPINCLYRFITFDNVLEIVFNRILSADSQIDFQQELLKTPTEMVDIDYDMTSYGIIKLVKCNVMKLQQLVTDFNDRKNSLVVSLEQIKVTLDQYLKRPDSSTKMHFQVDTICRKIQLLSDVLVSMVTSMAMWKLFKDLPCLYQSKNDETTAMKTCETILFEFRNSQKRLEQQIINLFKQFRDDRCDSVLKLLDQIFSENLELSICLPIFEDKLRKDSQMLSYLESLAKVSREEQFV